MSGPQRTSEERRISFENALSRSLKIGEGVWSCSRLDERTISALTDIAESYPRRSELLILAAQMRLR